ncbi:uncharacterized protein LOC124647661 [Lolium rigidum]|uniref:uncharacterized protein LOC124647661 n=1 Tax=Lolium rigidum TaxID=89674 RepID=UPI001F5DF743|nr:uncharacterized protein LOC124647661 [Lolium rigidum]
MMVAIVVVTGTVVADSSHHAFLGDLGLGQADGPEAVLDALPLSLCRHPLLRRCLWYQALSLLDCDDDIPSASESSAGHGADNSDGQNRGEDAAVRHHSSNDDSDDDENPFLTDSYGKVTTWRLSDLEAAFEKHLEDEASKPKVEVKKKTKEEILKLDNDRKQKFMEYALQKYNDEEGLAGEMRFVFDEIKGEVYVIEECLKFYEHFNFTAKQAGSMVLFFAEVIPSGDTCNVLCCKPLDCDDNGRCLSCEDHQSYVKMRHPADEALYVGGHEEGQFPFILESSSEDDSD